MASIADLIAALPDSGSEQQPSGWGPSAPALATMLDGVPYAPFSKGDKLGRMADWTSETKDGRERGGRGAYGRGRGMLCSDE